MAVKNGVWPLRHSHHCNIKNCGIAWNDVGAVFLLLNLYFSGIEFLGVILYIYARQASFVVLVTVRLLLKKTLHIKSC